MDLVSVLLLMTVRVGRRIVGSVHTANQTTIPRIYEYSQSYTVHASSFHSYLPTIKPLKLYNTFINSCTPSKRMH